MSNLPEGPWSFELDRDPESPDFTLSAVSIDADDEGRLRDYGRSIIEGTITDPTVDIQALGKLLSQAPTLAATVAAQREAIGALVGALEPCEAWMDHVLGVLNQSGSLSGRIPTADDRKDGREILRLARAALEQARQSA